MRSLIIELRQIRSRDDLLLHAPNLQQQFTALSEVIIRAQEYKNSHPEAIIREISKESVVADELRIELNRVLHIEGGREIIEKAQEVGLNRLDAFEKIQVIH